MAAPKHIAVLNSGCRSNSAHSWGGEFRLHFFELYKSEHTERLRGQVFDDVVWVRPLNWDNPDREYIEAMVRLRMVNRES